MRCRNSSLTKLLGSILLVTLLVSGFACPTSSWAAKTKATSTTTDDLETKASTKPKSSNDSQVAIYRNMVKLDNQIKQLRQEISSLKSDINQLESQVSQQQATIQQQNQQLSQQLNLINQTRDWLFKADHPAGSPP